MNKTKESLAEIKIAGLSVRTSNKLEMDPNTASIGLTIQRFHKENIISNIRNKVSDKFYSVFAEYESDHTGDYTYYYGVEVSSFDGIDENTSRLVIPKQDYTKFTTEKGKMPDIIIGAWMSIWKMNQSDFGGQRSYIADFEVHDNRSIDPMNSQVDIYIGVNSKL